MERKRVKTRGLKGVQSCKRDWDGVEEDWLAECERVRGAR